MKNIKWISILILMLTLYVVSYGQENLSRLSGFDIPVTDSVINIVYNPKGGPLEGMGKISGIVYMFNDYRWEVGDVELKNSNGILEGQFYVPKNCAFVAFKFINEGLNNAETFDNNDDKGFVYVTCDRSKHTIPGGKLAWGIFRKPSLGKGVPGYFSKLEIMDEALEMWVSKELETYSSNMPKFFDSYMAMVKLRTGENFGQAVNKFVPQFLSTPDLGEKQYIMVRNIYRYQLQNEQKADSLDKIILTKYPHGETARFQAFSSIQKMQMDEKKLETIDQFLKDFPFGEWQQHPEQASQHFIYYSTYRVVAEALFATKQHDKLVALIPDMDFNILNEVYRWNIFRVFKLKLLPYDQLYAVSDALIKEMIKKVNDKSYMEGLRYSPKQADEVAQAQFDDKLSTHISLLNKMGKYAEAKEYFDYLPDNVKYCNSDLNEDYINILDKTGGEASVLSVIEMGLKANAVTPLMLDRLKKMYVTKNGTESGFEAYVESLKSTDAENKLKERLKSELVKVKVDPFQLPAMDGAMVNSANLKGKIVVLDFWATWCFPCKMSFPGMQLAVDRYAKDPEVFFYFIATMERSKDYKSKIEEYFKQTGYRFNVLYDELNRQTQSNNLVFSMFTPLFKSSAIPRKVIIKDGYMRYTAEGYNGSPSELADEISYVIEMLKAED